MQRRGFTLMELLVVIAIIMVLAGLMLGAVSMIKHQAHEVQCRNNLQQIGIGIAAFQQENGNSFPQSLSQMFSPGKALAGENHKILLCPFDSAKGSSEEFNRVTVATPSIPSWGKVPEFWDPNHVQGGTQQPVFPYDVFNHSYMFEAENVQLGTDGQGWFPGFTTWSEAKVNQLKHGYPESSPVGPYRPEDFPIVRCFWHANWHDPTMIADKTKKVLNLSWAFNVIWTSPHWELGVHY